MKTIRIIKIKADIYFFIFNLRFTNRSYSAGIKNTSPPAPLHKWRGELNGFTPPFHLWRGAGGEVFLIPAE